MAVTLLEDFPRRARAMGRIYAKNATGATGVLLTAAKRAFNAARRATPIDTGHLHDSWELLDAAGGTDLVNEVEYAVPVDRGSATNAPAGMTAAALAAFNAAVRRARVLKGI